MRSNLSGRTVAQFSAAATHQPRPLGLSVAATAMLTLCTALLTRHVQVGSLSPLLAPVVFATAMVCAKCRSDSLLLLPALAYGALCLLYASIVGVESADAWRFIGIYAGVLLASQYGAGRIRLAWVLAPLALQCVVIVAISLALTFSRDLDLAIGVRSFAVDSEWGDIYSHDGLYYKVQLIGNALLPLAFMIAFCRWRQHRMHGGVAIMFAAGLIAAGNLTYLIVCAIYAVWQWVRTASNVPKAMAWATAILVLVTIGMAGMLIDTLEAKFDGSDSSMGVRFDQVDVIADAFALSPVTSLFGHGVGARFPNGKERAYSESQYIELQILYVTYQVGIVGVVLLFGTLAIALHRRMCLEGSVIFWMYVLCGITNPYILDTNQMVATMLLLAVFPRNRSASSLT